MCVWVGRGGGIISVNQEFYSYYVIYAAATYPVILHFLLSSRRILHNLLFQWLNLQWNLRLVYSYGVSCKKFYLLKISYSAYISNTSGQLEDRGVLEARGWYTVGWRGSLPLQWWPILVMVTSAESECQYHTVSKTIENTQQMSPTRSHFQHSHSFQSVCKFICHLACMHALSHASLYTQVHTEYPHMAPHGSEVLDSKTPWSLYFLSLLSLTQYYATRL